MNGDILKFQNKYRVELARRKGWDYSRAGCYFVTICAKNKEMVFGDVLGNGDEARVELSEIGKIVKGEWLRTPAIRWNVELDEWIIMPNHIHGIIVINKQIVERNVETHCNASLRDDEYQNKFGLQSNNLAAIIRGFKGATTKTINQKFPETNFAWQERFYDRIIRNEDELGKIREYIINNPLKWELDKNNPENLFM